MIIETLVSHGSVIGQLASDQKQALKWSLSNDIIYWYTKYAETNDTMALAICTEKYNELANLMEWEIIG